MKCIDLTKETSDTVIFKWFEYVLIMYILLRKTIKYHMQDKIVIIH